MRWLMAMALTIFALAVGPSVAFAEARVALVIGNGAYAHTSTLENPVNDANDIGAALKNVGFEVLLATNAEKRQLDRILRTFADKISKADVALFFYAGHGLQVGLQNFLVPVDAKLDRERDLEFEAVKLEFILRQMELEREGKTSIVILDACRDNTLSRNLARTMGTRSTAVGQGLAAQTSGLGTFIAYATQPGNVALDGEGRNSPFTTALIRHMGVKGRNLPATMIEVRKDVVAATRGRQVPWDHSSLTGDFQFVPDNSKVAPSPKASGTSSEVAALQERLRKLEEGTKKLPTLPATKPQTTTVATAPPVLPRGNSTPSKLTRDNAVRIDGNVMWEGRQQSPDACQAQCDATSGCIGYQHGIKHPVMGKCQLFNRIDQRQQDPNWRSGIADTSQQAASTQQPSTTALTPPALLFGGLRSTSERGFSVYEGATVSGEVIKTSAADSRQACGTVCRNTPGCVGATYTRGKGWNESCVVFRTLQSATTGNADSTALIRKD